MICYPHLFNPPPDSHHLSTHLYSPLYFSTICSIINHYSFVQFDDYLMTLSLVMPVFQRLQILQHRHIICIEILLMLKILYILPVLLRPVQYLIAHLRCLRMACMLLHRLCCPGSSLLRLRLEIDAQLLVTLRDHTSEQKRSKYRNFFRSQRYVDDVLSLRVVCDETGSKS